MSASEPGAKGKERAAALPLGVRPSICNLIDIWRQEANQYKSIDVPRDKTNRRPPLPPPARLAGPRGAAWRPRRPQVMARARASAREGAAGGPLIAAQPTAARSSP